MRHYQAILFDLDGTLTDPAEGITRSVQYALDFFQIQEPDLKKLHCFIGPPLTEAFMEFYGFSREQALQAVARYRERFQNIGIFENRLYPGMQELLAHVSAAVPLAVATSKPTVFAERILEHFEIRRYFQFVGGSELDGRRTDKAEVIHYVLEQMQLTDRADQVLMVGDRMHDLIGAEKNGLQAVGVLYGYGSQEELLRFSPMALAESVEHLEKILLGLLSDSTNRIKS